MAELAPDVCELRMDLMMAEWAGEYDASMRYSPRPKGQHNSAHRALQRRYLTGYGRIMEIECGSKVSSWAYPRPRQYERKHV